MLLNYLQLIFWPNDFESIIIVKIVRTLSGLVDECLYWNKLYYNKNAYFYILFPSSAVDTTDIRVGENFHINAYSLNLTVIFWHWNDVNCVKVIDQLIKYS